VLRLSVIFAILFGGVFFAFCWAGSAVRFGAARAADRTVPTWKIQGTVRDAMTRQPIAGQWWKTTLPDNRRFSGWMPTLAGLSPWSRWPNHTACSFLRPGITPSWYRSVAPGLYGCPEGVRRKTSIYIGCGP